MSPATKIVNAAIGLGCWTFLLVEAIRGDLNHWGAAIMAALLILNSLSLLLTGIADALDERDEKRHPWKRYQR